MIQALRQTTLATRIRIATALLALVVGAGFVAFLGALGQFDERADQHARHTKAIAQANRLERLIIDIQTGVRGYIITGQERFLDPWRAASADFPVQAELLLETLENDRDGRSAALALYKAGLRYLHLYSEPLIRLARRDRQAAANEVSGGEGKRRVDSIRAQFEVLSARETQKANALDSRMRDADTRATRIGVIGLVGSVALIALFAAYLSRNVSRPIGRISRAARRFGTEGIPTTVPEQGPAELAELARSFNAMALERDVAGKQLEAQNEKLMNARAEADRANRAKSEFLSRMSHELRTPLNAILGFGQLLEMDETEPTRRDSVDHILKGGRHLLGLIDEVLEISRIESGTLTISPEPVAIEPLVAEVTDLVRPLADARRIAIEVDSTEGIRDYVRADQQRLKQVLLNVLSNAVKYNRDGGQITIRCERPSAVSARISVSDTGPGIAADQLGRVFTPFDRLGAERTDVEGTGLGLALSKHLLELMGGELAVASEPGIETTFSIELPLVSEPLASVGLDEHEGAAIVDRSADERRTKVLYIEDNLSNYRLLEAIFNRRSDVELLSAIQGRIGLELAQLHQPDLVLLDLHLPDLSGGQVLESLQRDPRTADIPVVILSADATRGSRIRLLEAGAHAFLAKPFDLPELLGVIEDVLYANASMS